ncbi:MAG: branched-chain-amino-acid transaminase [Verrucomicrobiaceae bacterium]|nr:branched-chain-amino-acid transaminase [Verrucomicrobiaceae bacterium]
MTDAQSLCWQNNRIVDAATATISVLDHGLLYGDGVFEGIRFYRRRPFRLAAHLQRLIDSARAIGLSIPLTSDDLSNAITALIAAFGNDDGYLRLVVTRGAGPMGLDPSRCENPQVFIVASALQLISTERRLAGAAVIIAATRRLSADGLDPRIKSLNYLNHILARMEANHAGADEAILLNSAGRVTEGSADNVFVVKRGTLFTPPIYEGALDGITRGVVIELAQELELPLREIPIAPYDLHTADEIFLTGTGAELIPVRQVDGRPVQHCPGPIFQRIEQAFKVCIERDAEKENEWGHLR